MALMTVLATIPNDGDHSKDGDHPKDGDDHSGDDHSKDGGEKHEKEELK